jgi:hypothetical protein
MTIKGDFEGERSGGEFSVGNGIIFFAAAVFARGTRSLGRAPETFGLPGRLARRHDGRATVADCIISAGNERLDRATVKSGARYA